MLSATGVYVPGRVEPEKNFKEVLTPEKNFEFNTWLRRSIAHRAQVAWRAGAESESWQAMQAVWEATEKEVRGEWCSSTVDPPISNMEGVAVSGLSAKQLEFHPWLRGKSYRLIRRFGVFQNDKWRPVDDATENSINECTGAEEKVKLITADYPARVARAFVQEHERRGLEVPAVEQGTDDARKFFRRFPNVDPAYMVVALWDPACTEFVPENVVHFVLPSFIFGRVSQPCMRPAGTRHI